MYLLFLFLRGKQRKYYNKQLLQKIWFGLKLVLPSYKHNSFTLLLQSIEMDILKKIKVLV